MLSLYSGLDMNYTQTFPTYFGLARSRVDSFDLQQALCQQQQQQPQTSPTYSPTNMVTSSVSLVEPMIQSTLTMMPASNTPTPSLSSTSTSSSSVTSNSAIYYDAYPSTYTPNIDLSTSSTTSPSINDSWAHTTPTNLLPQSTYNYSFTSPLPSALPVQQDQQFSYTPTSSSYDTSQLRYHQKEEPQSYSACAITHSPVYDPVPPLLYPHGYHQHHSYQYNDIFTQSESDPLLLSPSPVIHSPTTSNRQTSNKRKRDQSPTMMNKKTYRSPSIASSSGSTSSSTSSNISVTDQSPCHLPTKEQQQQLCHQQNIKYNGSHRHSLANTEHNSSTYPKMNMISSFPTRINVSTSKTPKRYACHICAKKFTRPSSLTTHIYSHTGEKPFQCPMEGCGRHFSVVSNLRRHAKVHTLPSSLPKY